MNNNRDATRSESSVNLWRSWPEVADISVRKQSLQGLAKGKVGRYGGAALLCGTIGREADCRCCQEVTSAKGIQRDRERIDDVSSNMNMIDEDFRVAAVCLSIAVLQVSDRGATRTEEAGSVNGKMTVGRP